MNIRFLNTRMCLSLLSMFLMLSCSKDSTDEEPEVEVAQECEMEELDAGCANVHLQGSTAWVRILKQGDLADPLFLYPLGDKSEAYGTVTVVLENGFPVVKFNDVVLDDYMITISQSADGSDSFCKVGKDIEDLATGNESPSTIKLDDKLEFPFYIKVEANVCF